MTTIPTTKLYNLLSAKIGKAEAETLTTYIEEKIKAEVESKSQVLATKDDVAKLEIKLSETKAELIRWMSIFWIGQVAATFGFIRLFIKK